MLKYSLIPHLFLAAITLCSCNSDFAYKENVKPTERASTKEDIKPPSPDQLWSYDIDRSINLKEVLGIQETDIHSEAKFEAVKIMNGCLYVLDRGVGTVHKFSLDGKLLKSPLSEESIKLDKQCLHMAVDERERIAVSGHRYFYWIEDGNVVQITNIYGLRDLCIYKDHIYASSVGLIANEHFPQRNLSVLSRFTVELEYIDSIGILFYDNPNMWEYNYMCNVSIKDNLIILSNYFVPTIHLINADTSDLVIVEPIDETMMNLKDKNVDSMIRIDNFESVGLIQILLGACIHNDLLYIMTQNMDNLFIITLDYKGRIHVVYYTPNIRGLTMDDDQDFPALARNMHIYRYRENLLCAILYYGYPGMVVVYQL